MSPNFFTVHHVLKDYEQNLQLPIKESGNEMEHVTSNICVVVASLGKCINKKIMLPGGPSERTR